MEFGKLSDISSVNWTLPEDDPKNTSHLNLLDAENAHTYFGAPTWGSKHWLGKIYPPKTPSKEFLNYYAKNFTCIELNTTHYRIPDEKTASDWLSKVPPGFLFCPKVIKDISHARNGLVDKVTLGLWLNFLNKMQPNLGPCFIQLHEYFSYHEKMLLFKFLEEWPSEFKLTLELRHPSWFQEGVILPALTDYLNRKNIGLVITDVAGRRDVLHSSLSTNWSMIRLIGNNLDPSDQVRLRAWSKRIEYWQTIGLKDTFLFLHQPDDLMTIEFMNSATKIFTEEGFQKVPHLEMHSQLDLLSY